jgi:uncharacterized protein YtpQ (UPF0354 family)
VLSKALVFGTWYDLNSKRRQELYVGLIWRRSLSKKKFRNRFIEIVRKKHPFVKFELKDELGIVVNEFSGAEGFQIELDKAYKEFEENPEEIDIIFDRWGSLIDDFEKSNDTEIDVAAIFPIVKECSWMARIQSEYGNDPKNDITWFSDYNQELVLTYAEIRSGIKFLTVRNVEKIQNSHLDLKHIAIENLRRRTAERHIIGENGVYLIGGDGNVDASLLLDDQVFADERIQIVGDRIVGVPSRNFLVVSGAGIPSKVFNAAAMVSHLNKGEPYPISRKLFIRSGDIFQPLDSGLDDEAHPIPSIDVLDLHAKLKSGGSKLAIVIASPLKSDARSVFRFFQKLDGYLDYIASDAYKTEYGAPNPETTTIEVKIHPDSDEQVMALINSLSKWTQARNASLFVVQMQRIN